MIDKELADAVVAMGADDCGDYRWIEAGVIDSLPAEQFVRDWRVAGALMEKCDGTAHVLKDHDFNDWACVVGGEVSTDYPWARNESLPRAIIETCVKAGRRRDER